MIANPYHILTQEEAFSTVRILDANGDEVVTENDPTANNCGIGPGGFQPGNTCAKGGGGGYVNGGFTGAKGALYKAYHKVYHASQEYENNPSSTNHVVYINAQKSYEAAQASLMLEHESPEAYENDVEEIEQAVENDYDGKPLDAPVRTKSLQELKDKAQDLISKKNAAYDEFVKHITKDPEKSQAAQKEYERLVSAVSDAIYDVDTFGSEKTPEVESTPVTVMKTIQTLGGSTGAKLVLGSDGNRYVAKQGNNEGHIKEEYTANKIYEAMGVTVPKVEMIDMDGKPTQLGQHIEGRTLNQLKGAERTNAENKLRANFAADALMGNWDVIGMNADNVMVSDEDGEVYRIDNGGSLRYRAQGALKTSHQFGDKVDELHTMREKGMAGKVFSKLSDVEIATQIHDLSKNREAILAAAPEELRGVLGKRLDFMETWAGNAVNTGDANLDKLDSHISALEKGIKAGTVGSNADSMLTAFKTVKSIKAGDTGHSPHTSFSSPQEGHTAGGLYDHSNSKISPPKSSQDVEQLIKATKGSTVYTELQLAKIAVLNPEGVKDGKFNIAGVANAAHLEGHIAHLKSVLPEGTQLVKKHLNAKKVAELTGEDSEFKITSAGKKKLGEATSKPDGPGVIDHSLGTKIETGYTSYTHAGQGPKTVVEHNSTPYKLTATNISSSHEFEMKKWTAKASQDVKAAITSWTNGGYGAMRKRIASGKPNNEDKHLLKALNESPNFQGTVYRGIKAYDADGYGAKQMQAIAQAGVGGHWIDHSPMSTSRTPSKAHDFSGGHLMMKIHAKTGTAVEHLSIFGSEHEVIAKPGVKYRIKSVTKNAKVQMGHYTQTAKMFVELEEI